MVVPLPPPLTPHPAVVLVRRAVQRLLLRVSEGAFSQPLTAIGSCQAFCGACGSGGLLGSHLAVGLVASASQDSSRGGVVVLGGWSWEGGARRVELGGKLLHANVPCDLRCPWCRA